MNCEQLKPTSQPKRLAIPDVARGEGMSRAKLKAHEQKLLQDIRKAHLSGKRKLVVRKQQQYLTSFASRFIATEAAYKKLRPSHRPPMSALPSISKSLNPWCGTNEKVEVIWKPKKNNPHDFRPTMNFGIENRALQYLVVQCLYAQAEFHPMQFAINLGRQEAVQKALDLMCSGLVYVTEMDITNCYQSFNGEKLAGILPLPKEVTE